MTLKRSLMIMTAAAALSFGFTACDDDSTDAPVVNPTVKNPTCDDNILVTYNEDGTEKDRRDCTANGNVCKDGACVVPVQTDPAKCSEADNKCDGNNLITCDVTTGKTSSTTCEFGCDAVTKSCKDEGQPDTPECVDEDYQNVCTADGLLESCKDGKIVKAACGDGKKCANNACVDLTDEEKCVATGGEWKNEQCVAVTESIVGGACSCKGNCTIEITGKELKNILASGVKLIAGAMIPDDMKITAPNFFPGADNIEGCDGLKADGAVPEGMTLGCLTDSKIEFVGVPSNLTNLIPTIIGMMGSTLPEGIDTKVLQESITNLLNDGIPFAAPQGYCLAAAIDISGTVESNTMAGGIITSDALSKDGLLSKINTGDHSTAKDANCPAGSTKFAYSINGPVEKLGTIDLGFDMCLKSCTLDTDCREGYTCTEIPNGVPGEGQTSDDLTKYKVCFDQSNIEYFTNLTNSFTATTPAE